MALCFHLLLSFVPYPPSCLFELCSVLNLFLFFCLSVLPFLILTSAPSFCLLSSPIRSFTNANRNKEWQVQVPRRLVLRHRERKSSLFCMQFSQLSSTACRRRRKRGGQVCVCVCAHTQGEWSPGCFTEDKRDTDLLTLDNTTGQF